VFRVKNPASVVHVPREGGDTLGYDTRSLY